MKKKLPEGNFLSDEGSDFTTSQVPRQSSQQQCARRRHGPEVHKHTRKGFFFFLLQCTVPGLMEEYGPPLWFTFTADWVTRRGASCYLNV